MRTRQQNLYLAGVILTLVTNIDISYYKARVMAWHLSHQAQILENADQYATALSKRLEAVKSIEKIGHPEPPLLIHLLNRLGINYNNLSLYPQAEEVFKHAIRIIGSNKDEYKEDYIISIQGQALIDTIKGNIAPAEASLNDILSFILKNYGSANIQYARTLQQLGVVHHYKGNYPESERALTAALDIAHRVVHEKTHDYASILGDLGRLYRETGKYDISENYLKRVIQLRSSAGNELNNDCSFSYHELGLLYMTKSLYSLANDDLLRALQIKSATIGEGNSNFANTLSELGRFNNLIGRDDLAKHYIDRSVPIIINTLGKKNRMYAALLTAQGTSNEFLGNYAQAAQLYSESTNILISALGPEHPDVGSAFLDSAFLFLHWKNLSKAVSFMKRAAQITEYTLLRACPLLADSEQVPFLDTWPVEHNMIYTALYLYPKDSAMQHLAMSTTLLRKGRSWTEAASLSAAAYRLSSSEERADYDRLRALRSRAANLATNIRDQLDAQQEAAARQELTSIEHQAEQLEQTLLNRSAPLRARQIPTLEEVTEQVSMALPADSILIEIVSFTPLGFLAPDEDTKKLRYLAISLTPSGQITVADLGSAAPIDTAIQKLRSALADPSSDYLPIAQEVYRQVFRPLQKMIAGRRHILFSPDGQELSLLPPAVLHDGKNFLQDEHLVSFVTSGRDLLRRVSNQRPSSDVVVLADPAFNQPPSASSLPGALAQRHVRWSYGPLSPLPGSRAEAATIAALFPSARLLLGTDATDTALLGLQAPGILHIATHGVFDIKKEVPVPSTDESRGTWSLVTASPSDPMLRSGLVLAGARWAQNRPVVHAQELEQPDGLVTAQEMTGMNLWGTQLVVLSACDTARGDAHLGQGMYGMRRAVMISGAETLVTSLWRVDDAVTKDLMADYYQNLLAGAGRADALQEAAIQVKREHPHPYYWASFISIGRTEPLRGMK